MDLGIQANKQLIIDDLYNRYGGMMTAVEVGKYLGLKHHISYEKWLRGLPIVIVNGRKRWRISDIAEKISKNII